jgi:hypothetical protein
VAAVNSSYTATLQTVRSIDERVEDSQEVTFDLQPEAERVGDHIQAIYTEMQRGLGQLVDSSLFAETTLPLVTSWVAAADQISDDVTGIAELHATAGNYSDDVVAVGGAVKRANRIAGQAMTARDLSLSLNVAAENLIGQLQNISADVDIQSSSGGDVCDTLGTVQRSLDASESMLSGLIEDVSTIDNVIARAQTQLESSKGVIEFTNVSAVCEGVDHLTEWIGNETLERYGSGTESQGFLNPEESGDGIEPEVSGSGMGLGPDSLTGRVASLSEEVERVGVALEECGGVVNTALNYSSFLQEQAEAICSVLEGSLESGGAAVEAILNYTASIEAVEEAVEVAMEASEVLGEVVMVGEGAELRNEAQQLLEMSESLLRDAITGADQAGELVDDFHSVAATVDEAGRQVAEEASSVEYLDQRVTQLANVSGECVTEAQEKRSHRLILLCPVSRVQLKRASSPLRPCCLSAPHSPPPLPLTTPSPHALLVSLATHLLPWQRSTRPGRTLTSLTQS